MRLFVAVEIDAGVAARVAAAGEELRPRVLLEAPAARITWVPPERMHATVRFLGEVEPPQADRIGAALAPPIDAGAFDLTVRGVGVFPTRGAPRVLWAGLVDEARRLTALQEQVNARLSGCGIAPDDRPYRPHLTMARVRDAAGLRARPLVEGMADREFGTTSVDAITLFHSRLSSKGPTYVPLQRTPLLRT